MERVHTCTNCQQCNAKITITGLDSLQKDSAVSSRQSAVQSALGASVLGGGRIDDSFIFLDPRKQSKGTHGQGRLEESFMMVSGTASLIRQGGAQGVQASRGLPLQEMDSAFQRLARTFEIASGTTEVDQPLCPECTVAVREEVERSLAELEAECAAYQKALNELSQQAERPLAPSEFDAELAAAKAELRDEEAKARQAEKELEEAQAELADLREQSGQLEASEEQYWQAVNHLGLALRSHAQQRTSLQRKIWQSEEQLKKLQATNVYNDMFHIWYDGPFGTISGFRLGRTPSIPVEWDEINAAWGQAVLLLHTMAQACKLTFSGYRLYPMGSFSQIADKKATMDLFGPVSKLYCTSYDRAMVSFLACLKEFYEFAQGRDKAEGRTPLEIVYAIDGDLVGGVSIRLMFSKDAKWTCALKYMLGNLKWALAWMNKVQGGQSLRSEASRPAAMTSSM